MEPVSFRQVSVVGDPLATWVIDMVLDIGVYGVSRFFPGWKRQIPDTLPPKHVLLDQQINICAITS